MKVRNQTADLLKGIAVLLMVQIHILELFAGNVIYLSSVSKFFLFLGGPPVAPVFMILFGYFIAVNKKTKEQQIIRGLQLFLLGMLLNTALNLNLIITVSRGIYQVDLLPYIFGVDILHFAGISMILIAFLKKIFDSSLLFLIACMVGAAFLGHFLTAFIPENTVLKYVTALFYGSCSWSYFPLFPWLSYPLAGLLIVRMKERFDFRFLFSSRVKTALGIAGIIFLICTFSYALAISSDLQAYYHHGVLFYLWVLCFIFFYSLCIGEIHRIAGNMVPVRYLKWLGKNVTLIYCMQWILVGNMATEIYKTVESPFCLLIYFTGIVFLSSCAGYALLRWRGQPETSH